MQRGDIITCIRSEYFPFTYRHYGIYVGNNKVVHFDSSYLGGNDHKIRLTSLNTFSRDENIEVDNYPMNEIIFTRDEIVNRAYDALHHSFGSYDFINNNCEHFAMWIACNKKISRQSLPITGCIDQDIVCNAIDTIEAVTSKVIFDPLIKVGEAFDEFIDRLFK